MLSPPRTGAGLLQVGPPEANRTAGSGGQALIHLILAEVAVDRNVFRAHFGPVAFELLSDHLRAGRNDALPHLGLTNANRHRIIRRDHQPWAYFDIAFAGQ